MTARAALSILWLTIFTQLNSAQAAESSGNQFEKPSSISAREWWDHASWLQTDLWEVRDEVQPNDFTNHYSIDTVYGPMEAWSDQNLLARLREIAALHWLRQQGAGRAGGRGTVAVATGKLELVEDLATMPLATVFDVPRGARALIRRAGAFALEERRHSSYTSGGPVRGLLGANDRKRALAARLQVDPYSDNEPLQKELERVALLEALPDFSIGLAIPGNGLFSILETGRETRMMDAYLASPSDLFLENRKTLQEIGVPKELAADFLSIPFSTPAQQTILTRALASLSEAEERTRLIAMATDSSSREEFDFYRRTAELLSWYQANEEPVARIESQGWLPVAVTTSGKRVLPFAVDLGGWCIDCGSALSVFATEGRGNVVAVTGKLTPRAQAELAQRGVAVLSAALASKAP